VASVSTRGAASTGSTIQDIASRQNKQELQRVRWMRLFIRTLLVGVVASKTMFELYGVAVFAFHQKKLS
jgi:hypothetical protein